MNKRQKQLRTVQLVSSPGFNKLLKNNMILFWFITAAAICGIFLTHAYGNLRKVQANWSEYRCNPSYMLFAGIVDPATGIGGNFRNCMNLIGSEVVGSMTDALGSQFAIIAEMLRDIANPLALFRQMISTIRKFILSFASTTLSKASAPVGAFVYTLNKVNDLLRRMFGEGFIMAYFGASAVGFMESFISFLLGVIKAFVVAMLIISVILALFQPEILAMVLVLSSALMAAGV